MGGALPAFQLFSGNKMIKICSTLIRLPDFSGGTSSEVFKGTDSVIINIISNTNNEDYKQYVQVLQNDGFSVYDSHSIGQNFFTTLVKEVDGRKVSVQVYYTVCNDETRVIIEPDWTSYPLTTFQNNSGIASNKNKTTLFQFELDYRNVDCGMCYIIRAEDGSFFIIDSGHMDSVTDHIRLHDFLRTLTGENEKIRISGWFFSHAHQDHIAKFMDFIEAGFDDYIIEKLYYNFPSLEFAPGCSEWNKEDNETIKQFNQLIKKHPELKVCKLHCGNHFFIDNLEFEVLGTHEDIYPLSVARFNDTSTVLMLTVDDCRILFPGDANNKMSYLLVSRYADLLKSDILQLSHHGFSGGTPELYERSKSSVVLVPTDRKHFEENLYREANKTALRYAKEVYICSEGTVSLPLPYKSGCATIHLQEINR